MGPNAILDEIEKPIAEHNVAAVTAVNTGLSGGYRLMLPKGHVARFCEEGIEFDFKGKTPQQIEQELNQLLNLCAAMRDCTLSLGELCKAYRSAARDFASENKVMLMTEKDLTAWEKKHGRPS